MQLKQISAGLNLWRVIIFSDDGSLLVGVTGEVLHVWDAFSGENFLSISRPGGLVRSLVSSADGRWLAAGTDQVTCSVKSTAVFIQPGLACNMVEYDIMAIVTAGGFIAK